MAFFRQVSGSLTADDCADCQLRISVPTNSQGSSRVHWKGRTRSSKHSGTLGCFLKNDRTSWTVTINEAMTRNAP